MNAPADLRSDAPHFARDRQGGAYYTATFAATAMPRILIAGYQHETNTFAPSLADWAAFTRGDSFPAFVRGAGRSWASPNAASTMRASTIARNASLSAREAMAPFKAVRE